MECRRDRCRDESKSDLRLVQQGLAAGGKDAQMNLQKIYFVDYDLEYSQRLLKSFLSDVWETTAISFNGAGGKMKVLLS